MKTNCYSPLRYPGGKSRLIDFFSLVIEQNNLQDGTYIEPFSGGAAVALSLAIDGKMKRVVINDYDRSIYAFWYSVLYHTDELVEKIQSTQLSLDEWHRQREVQIRKNTANILDLGFSTFYLNRTNRSGVLKAGVIGGVNQTGTYKIDARYNKEQLISRIKLIAQHKNKIVLHNENAIDLLRRYRNMSSKNLVYLDPPYFVKGRELYVNFFKLEDHVELAKYIQDRTNMNWILTYDNHEFISNLYSEANKMIYTLPYSAGANKSGEELLIWKKNIVIPKDSLPDISEMSGQSQGCGFRGD